MQEEFATILSGVVRVVHNRTSDREYVDFAVQVIVDAGRVLSAINRAMVMAVCFVDSDGQCTTKVKR